MRWINAALLTLYAPVSAPARIPPTEATPENRPAVLGHPLTPGLLHPPDRSNHVDRQDLLDRAQVCLDGRPVLRVRAGVVHQQVQPAEPLDHLRDRVTAVLGVPAVPDDPDRLAAHPQPVIRPGEVNPPFAR